MRLGVLDVGSNTVHMLIVDAHVGAAPIPATSHKRELRLAEHLTADGHLTPEIVQDLTAVIIEGALVERSVQGVVPPSVCAEARRLLRAEYDPMALYAEWAR